MKITPQARRQQLIEAGVYDANSLALNLQGGLSKRQRVKLMIHSFLWFFVSGLNILMLLFLFVLDILYPQSTGVLFAWIITLGVLSFLGYRQAQPFWKDIQEDTIKTASGQIRKEYFFIGGRGPGRRGGDSYWLVRIHNIQFSVSPTLYSSLMDGASYRLFYVPNSGWVLNVDTIG
jgi:hypothetical protein